MDNIVSKILPSCFIVTNTYDENKLPQKRLNEIYLTEMINHSKWFAQKYGLFRNPTSESNSEPDAFSDNYSVDFKLAISKSCCKDMNKFSPQFVHKVPKTKNEVAISEKVPKVEKGEIHFSLLHNILKKLTYEDLVNVNSINYGKLEKDDVKNFIKLLNVEKNLMFFFPFEFASTINERKLIVNDVVEFINDCFSSSMQYRIENLGEYDTFFVILLDSKFYIMINGGGVLSLIDSVDTELCDEFVRIEEYYTDRKIPINFSNNTPFR